MNNTVVFVDDDPLSKLLADRASARLRCQFLCVEKIAMVFESIDHIAPRLVILDLAMTDLDGSFDPRAGIRVASALRARYGDRFPILILTGMDSIDLVEESLRNGADDYCLKSHDLTSLLKRLAAWLVVDYRNAEPRRRREDAAAALTRLVASRRECALSEWRGAANRELSPTEETRPQAGSDPMAHRGAARQLLAHDSSGDRI